MKKMNMFKKYGRIDLQVFAEGGDGAGDDNLDDGSDDDSDDDSDGEPEEDEKKFSQNDVDELLKKRLAREKRKWKRAQEKQSKEDDSDNSAPGDDKSSGELAAANAKVEELELKWTVLEHDVEKSSVDDVLALAKVYMSKDEGLDIEEAVEKVLEKYPQFKIAVSTPDDDKDEPQKPWGTRKKGKSSKLTGVEAAFLARNPGLKID